MNKSYISFEEKRKNLKQANGYLVTNGSTKIFSFVRFEKSGYTELENRIGFLTPGKYRISAYFSYTITVGNCNTTYEGKENETIDFEIFPNALTVIFTDFDQIKGKTVLQLFQSKVNPDLHKFSASMLQNSGKQICPSFNIAGLKIN
ncbi:hypothetical protein [Leptospira terpstrae]|uniref:Uncharacterized protein n=1 Tax=Leptospira terpstrae serovar Hualin str. LT 11-33 = ATCC 700639 TaxID=1257025 RepID=N1W4H2_9LEPT|nr:hypothetical protein [Leptospira terpstrae]EMY62586.1 hypothetical protein LEP1GSC203_2876 [Leptospira terpstrae serovar Hualin str. LT 11-33 = ATCC 700639]